MITIGRNEKDVTVKIETTIGYHIILNYPRATEMDSVLLRNQLSGDLHDFIEYIRRDAYEEGWKDKTKRNRKRTYFPRAIIKNPTW